MGIQYSAASNNASLLDIFANAVSAAPPSTNTQFDQAAPQYDELFEEPIDSRFEYLPEQQAWRFTGADRYINYLNNNPQAQQQQAQALKLSPESVIQLPMLIQCLQELNQEYSILTDLSVGSSSMQGYVGSSNTQRRRIRQLRFELDMLKR